MDTKGIISLANELSEAIKSSGCYKACEEYGRKISADDELMAKIDYYKSRRMDYCIKKADGVYLEFEDEKELSKLYFDLALNEDAKAYIDSQNELLELLFEVQDIIGNSCDVLKIWE